MLLKLLLFINILHMVWSGECGAKFQGKCQCGIVEYEEQQKYVVNCTNSGFRDTTMLEFLPTQTEILIFTGNYIQELPWNVFGAINELNLLTIVDMSNNHIREIRGKSYHHVQNVQRLILNHNNLSISRDDDDINHHHPRVLSNFVNLMELHLTNAFADNTSAELSEDLHDIFVNSNLTKLRKLHLEQNEITEFKDRRVFCDLPSLRDLHLGDNLLREINFNVICLKHLRFLDLERNKFENVKLKDMNMLDTLQSLTGRDVNLIVDYTYNPFDCSCGLLNFYDWLQTTQVEVRNKEKLICYRNKQYEERIITLKLNKCRLNAINTKTGGNGHTITLIFLLIVLSCILVGLIGALIYVSKDRLKNFLNPVLDTVSKKVQYTTIKDEECQEVHV